MPKPFIYRNFLGAGPGASEEGQVLLATHRQFWLFATLQRSQPAAPLIGRFRSPLSGRQVRTEQRAAGGKECAKSR